MRELLLHEDTALVRGSVGGVVCAIMVVVPAVMHFFFLVVTSNVSDDLVECVVNVYALLGRSLDILASK